MADKKIIVIDPERDPKIYYDYAEKNNARIVGVIETHPHADFASAHLEIHKKLNVPIYSSSLTKSKYPLTSFDDGKIIKLSETVGLRSMFTPGHSPDHISAVLFEKEKDIAVFSGDSLFIGDVGRPDLRDFSKDVEAQRQKLAESMYDTIHQKFAKLDDEVLIYPAHGAGTLCGKSIRKALSSTIGEEKASNYAFEKRTKEEFVSLLLNDQPFIPKYFQHAVTLNILGAPDINPSLSKVKLLPKNFIPGKDSLIIDSRSSAAFKKSYIDNSINIPAQGSFETWLGTIVEPNAKFYLVAGDDEGLKIALKKAAAIGYELKVKGAFIYDSVNGSQFSELDKNAFKPNDDNYTIIDVRTSKEVKEKPIFRNSINIPLQELGQRMNEIPKDKPIVVNCASGYRSAAGSSLIKKSLHGITIYDLGPAVEAYLP
jgi:glyoxylase-like metal-dependent hydrolase (beta-lactamase superfamily II)/rhodanese-related sulfurtransferase